MYVISEGKLAADENYLFFMYLIHTPGTKNA